DPGGPRRRHRRTSVDPPTLRQGAADQPDHHVRPRPADRGVGAADLGRHRPALRRAVLAVRHLSLGPLLITKYRFAVRAMTAAVLIALWLFLEYTPFGRILRAGSRDPEMVGLLGITLPRVLMWVFGLGCAISGIAGLLAAPIWTITPAMATNAIMPAFVIVAIGGLGSFAGAVIAGLLVGVVIALTIQFKPEASGAVMYVFMTVMLVLRPRGLLGERWE